MTLLLSPLSLLLMALAIIALALAGRHRRIAWVAALVALLAIAAMTPLLANALVAAVESRAVAGQGDCERLQAVVFLSGGLQRAPHDNADLSALTPDTVARIFGLYRNGRGIRLPMVISGGGPYSVAESDVIATLMMQLGSDPARVLLESHSRSTWESPAAVRRLLPSGHDRIALASSALHLPRAMLVYRAAGYRVCPWPLSTRYQRPQGIGALVPQTSGLRKSEAAFYEIAGIAWYRARLLSGSDSSSR